MGGGAMEAKVQQHQGVNGSEASHAAALHCMADTAATLTSRPKPNHRHSDGAQRECHWMDPRLVRLVKRVIF